MSSLDLELAPFRIPLQDIEIATKDFAEENLLKHSGKADVYKGVLLLPSKVGIGVVIWKFGRLSSYGSDTVEFYEEIKRISRFKHKNFVSFVGFCDEKDKKMIVMEHVVNGSLDKFLSDPTLTWYQRLHICLGATLALKFWHNINNITYFYKIKGGFKILLDKDWKAKVLISIESGNDPKNSDVYSLGVIWLEVLYGSKATIEAVNRYLAIMAKNNEDGEQLDDIVPPKLRTQMQAESLSIFSEIAYNCLKEQPHQQTLNMLDHIVKKLREAIQIQLKHENLLRVEKLGHLKIPLSHVKLATHDFADTYRIKSLINDSVYRAELAHFHKEGMLKLEGDDEGKLTKKTVIIKRITKDYEEKSKASFIAKIEMLIKCKHANLLSFLGFCYEESEMILVFECSFKKTLNDCLRSRSNRTNLTWEKRMRICLDIAHGLKYLHNMLGKPRMTGQIIQSVNVFLDENWTAKIAIFSLTEINACPFTSLWGSSFCQSQSENISTLLWGSMSAPQRVDLDEIFALGVILFEILTGGLTNHVKFYMTENVKEFASMAKQHFHEGKLVKNMVDPNIRGEAQHSLDTFSKITYQCLTLETPSVRPTFEVVINSLQKALDIQCTMLQVQKMGHLKIPLEDIKSATKSFDVNYRIGSGGYGEVYKAKLKMKSKDEHLDTPNTVAVKRISSRTNNEGIEGFLVELDIVSKCKHPNIVTLLGFCIEDGVMLLVYEFASNGSLDDYLENIDRTWAQRLKMCIDISQGLKYMHMTMEDKQRIIHRDIKSANILLGKNWEAKIADFGLSKVQHGNQGVSTIYTKTLAGTQFYLDPEYARTGMLRKASDIYSLGVVLFEIFSGKLAYDSCYTEKNEKGIASIARRHFKNGTVKEILDPKIMDEAYELGFIGKRGPDHDSLDVFSRIAYQCVAKTQIERPTIRVIVEELEKALQFQENRIKTLKFSLEHIRLGVEDFSGDNCIMRGGYGMVYKGKVQYNNRHKKVLIKRFSRDTHLNDTSLTREHGFLKEFEVLFKYKHKNIIGLVGYCKEMDEKIIVYENTSNGSLDRYLNDTSFSWTKRLNICIDIAKGLKFLHGGDLGQDVVIHRDLKSSNILLDKNWKAKICGFELALTYPTNQKIEYAIDNVEGSLGYSDPMYFETYFLTKESDIYSFGVILFEILCGRLACLEDFRDRSQFLDVLVKRHTQEAPLEEMVFDGLKEQIAHKSFATFKSIAFQCLLNDRKERPTAGVVEVQLQKALEYQEAYEKQEAKLHRNHKKILTKSPQINSEMAKKDIYKILSKGILLEHDKLEIIRALRLTTSNPEQEDNDFD